MERLKEMLMHLIKGISTAVFRFPLTVVSLIGTASIICYMISLHKTPSLTIEKLMFTFLVGAILGMTAQFASERFLKLARLRPAVYVVSALLTVGYFFILWPAPEISLEISVRTFVAVFALVCAVLWLPAYKDKADFNQVALIHFKSAATSILYSGVLSGGLAAIIAAVDILLFRVNEDTYAYMMTLVWVLFAPVYYLSLLPRFNSEDGTDIEALRTAGIYPKFLAILVSNIAIPLISAYTLVLAAYFIKILVTLNWPSGQLGPMILIYSAVGLLIFVLASMLDNRFAVFYRKIFPKVLIPVVIMQMVSVGIRLNAYGVTESRYYVVLFGIFSIVVAVLLSIKSASKNSYIALLAAAFAIFSIIPPLDAFTVSRVSQITRVENILKAEGMLANDKITPKADASRESKEEITNILSYLDRNSSLKYIAWLPDEFNIYEDLERVIGFRPTYPNHGPEDFRYFFINLDHQQPIIISDYDISINISSERSINNLEVSSSTKFSLKGEEYELYVQRSSGKDRILVKNSAGSELIGTEINDFIEGLEEKGGEHKEMLPPEKMTLEVTKDNYRLKIIFRDININYGSEPGPNLHFSAIVLFGAGE